jgi:hypothetical protein
MKFNDPPNAHLIDELPEVFTILDIDKGDHYEACNFIVGIEANASINSEHKYLLMERESHGRKVKRYVSCRLFYSRPDKSQGYGIGIYGTSPPIFFKFADCNHKYHAKNLGNCYNSYTCLRCGDSYTVDSSD